MKPYDWLRKNGTWSSQLNKSQVNLKNSPEGKQGYLLFNIFRAQPETAESIRSNINEALQIQFERDMLIKYLHPSTRRRCRP